MHVCTNVCVIGRGGGLTWAERGKKETQLYLSFMQGYIMVNSNIDRNHIRMTGGNSVLIITDIAHMCV